MYVFDKNLKLPLYKQLYEQIKDDIKKGELKVNDKLPSIRNIANLYNLSKNTVQTAYDQLYAEGYIDSIPQKGYFIMVDLYKEELLFDKKIKSDEEKQIEYLYDFFPAFLEPESFPKKIWQKLYNRVLKEDINFGFYHNIQGFTQLREELSLYLNSSRALSCNKDEIIILSGFSDAMFLLGILLKDEIKKIALEENAYRVGKKVFSQLAFDCEHIKNKNSQIDLEQLEKSKANLLLLTPAHQYLSGQSIPINHRLKLLSWAKENKAYIIEDDYDSELSYYNSPIPSIKGIDTNDRVIYFGTFSKSLSPALRLAYLVLPKHLIKKYKECFDYHFSGVSLDIQKTMSLFMKEGYFKKHIRKIRTLNKNKHDFTKAFLEKELANLLEVKRQGSGLNLLIKPKDGFLWEYFEELCLKNKVKITCREDYYKNKYISLGYGGFSFDELQKALELFVKLFKLSIK